MAKKNVKYKNFQYLLDAIKNVYDRWERNLRNPAAARWIEQDKDRPVMFEAINEEWMRLTKCIIEFFPYTGEVVVDNWVAYSHGRTNAAGLDLRFRDYTYLQDAVGYLYDAWKIAKKDPGAERWSWSTRWAREKVVEPVLAEWMLRSGSPSYMFPYHGDAVIECWVAYRKTTESEKVALRRIRGKRP